MMRSVDFARMFHSWLGASLPVPVENLPRLLGIGVSLADMDALEGSLVVEHGKCLIVLNRRRTLPRRRFTLAHEIGHWLYCPQSLLPIKPEPVQHLELHLNLFASELLMPRIVVLNLWELYKANPHNRQALISERLLVSRHALCLRLDELGITIGKLSKLSGCYCRPT